MHGILVQGDDHDDDAQWRRLSPPENEVPVPVPVSVVLARTDTVAVTLTGVQVFSTGISMSIGLRCRPEALELLDDRDVNGLLFGHGRHRDQLLVGVEISDGRRASNLPGRGPFADRLGPDALVLHSGGGGGGQLAADHAMWLSPVPPAGPLRVVVRCDALGLPETVTELDGTAIAAAAAGVVTLWPWVSPREAQPLTLPPAPDLPADSWFART